MGGHVAIIGGGIIGLCAAWALRERGWSVTVVDPDEIESAASWGNAGHIATEQVEPLASWATVRSVPSRAFTLGGAVSMPWRSTHRWLPFALRLLRAANEANHSRTINAALLSQALPAWRELMQSLGQHALLRETGHFVLWESEESARRGLQSWRSANVGTTSFREITNEERAKIAQLLSRPPAGGIRFAGSGQIADPLRLRSALHAALRDRQCVFVRGRASSIRGDAARWVIQLVDGNAVASDAVVIAAGVRSAPLLAPFGVRAPLIAERGYHLQSADHRWPDLPPVVFEDRSLIVTRFESALRVASFLEFSHPDAPPDARKWQRLQKHVAALGIALLGSPQQWVGSRPTLPDYLPAIGRLAQQPNVYYAFGHNHLGLTLGPLTGLLLSQLMTQTPQSFDIAPFRIERFA